MAEIGRLSHVTPTVASAQNVAENWQILFFPRGIGNAILERL